MKNYIKMITKKAVLFSVITSIALTGGVGTTFAADAQANSNPHAYEAKHATAEAKYSKKVMNALEESLAANPNPSSVTIEEMAKVEVMDRYLTSFGKKVKGNEVRVAVKEVFDIDLNLISKNNYGSKPDSYSKEIMDSVRASFMDEPITKEGIMALPKNEVMDRYIKMHDSKLSGQANRNLINAIFGVNLNGISGLEHSQLAIHSKGQWILKSDSDLFILKSSLDDVDVSIYATPYFKQLTGSNVLPASLVTQLTDRGFTYNADTQVLYYKDPNGNSVPDSFKGGVIGVLMPILSSYQK